MMLVQMLANTNRVFGSPSACEKFLDGLRIILAESLAHTLPDGDTYAPDPQEDIAILVVNTDPDVRGQSPVDIVLIIHCPGSFELQLKRMELAREIRLRTEVLPDGHVVGVQLLPVQAGWSSPGKD